MLLAIVNAMWGENEAVRVAAGRHTLGDTELSRACQSPAALVVRWLLASSA